MKIFKFIIPLYIFTFIFTSCKKDDDTDEIIKEEALVINRETSAYEEEWYKKYLIEELFETTKEIDSLEEVLANNPNEPDIVQIKLDIANAELAQTSTKLGNLGQAAILIKKWPRPPGPCPREPMDFLNFLEENEIEDNFGCDPIEMTHLITNLGDEIISLSITNENDESVLSSFSAKLIKVDEAENEVKAQSIKLVDGFSGKAKVKVVKKNPENVEIAYETVISFY